SARSGLAGAEEAAGMPAPTDREAFSGPNSKDMGLRREFPSPLLAEGEAPPDDPEPGRIGMMAAPDADPGGGMGGSADGNGDGSEAAPSALLAAPEAGPFGAARGEAAPQRVRVELQASGD